VPTDIFWLQLRANALMKKEQHADAVDSFLAAAKITSDAHLLRMTGDLAHQAKRPEVAVWCYEQIVEKHPDDASVRGNLAHLYAFVLTDFEKAAAQYRELRRLQPDNLTHTFNLAICLAQIYRPAESLTLYEELCEKPDPSIQAVLGRAKIHHSLNHPDQAMASLTFFRARFWGDPDFLMALMSVAHAAGAEELAHEALTALSGMQQKGELQPGLLRPMAKDEGLETFKQLHKQELERTEYTHGEMLKGRMPWVWAEQVSNNALYVGWRFRTQEIQWLGDDPANRARFCIYATNSFHARAKEGKCRQLLPLLCPPAGTRIVADISALITLHRLGLLDAAADRFGEILVPAGYLPTVLEDSRNMVLPQRTQQQGAEEITRRVTAGNIIVEAESVTTQMPIVDEYTEPTEHRYHLIDLITPLHTAGAISEAEFASISRVFAKPSATDNDHPPLVRCQDVLVDAPSLETLTHFGLLDALVGFYRLHIRADAHRDLTQRLAAIAWREETRQWHMDLWDSLRADPRFRFLPSRLPDDMLEKGRTPKDFLPFLACFLARDNQTPLMADDRMCQAFTLNEMQESPHAAFGTDVLALALMDAVKLDSARTAAIFRQLIAWRYRFIVPPATVLKVFADQYRTAPPGLALQEMAEYVQDCMRDTGLFGGQEKTELGDSMAMRSYLTWTSSVAEFLIMVWADEAFTADNATSLTSWCVRELMPAIPRVVVGPQRLKAGQVSASLLVSHALIKTATHAGSLRMADAMKAIKGALSLTNDEYARIVTETLNASSKTHAQS
jgi:hypothetical protein